MFNNYFNKNLKEDEELIQVIRIFPLALANHILISLLIILLSFFLFYILLKQGGWGLSAWLIILLSGIFYGLRTWIIWSLNGFVITSQRIIDYDQKGFFTKTVSECTLDKIQDVSYQVIGPWQTMLHFGSVKLQTAGSLPSIEIHRVRDPHKLQQLITDTQRRYSAGDFEESEEMSATELLDTMRTIRAEIGEEQFKKILERKKGTKSDPSPKD